MGLVPGRLAECLHHLTLVPEFEVQPACADASFGCGIACWHLGIPARVRESRVAFRELWRARRAPQPMDLPAGGLARTRSVDAPPTHLPKAPDGPGGVRVAANPRSADVPARNLGVPTACQGKDGRGRERAAVARYQCGLHPNRRSVAADMRHHEPAAFGQAAGVAQRFDTCSPLWGRSPDAGPAMA